MKLPGFIDSHLHVLGIGYVASNADLTNASSIDDMIDILQDYQDRQIIIGRGWNQDQLIEKRMPTKNDLNQVSTDVPIVIIRVCGHVISVNDKMLEMAGIHKETPGIYGGSFDFNTGIFKEKALSLIYEKMPKPTKDDLRDYFLTANQLLIEQGITHVASDDFCIFDIDYKVVIEVLSELYHQGLMDVKITEQVNLPIHKLKDFIKHGFVRKQIHPKFKMGPLKILSDGSLGGRTAAMIEPYTDAPDTNGILTFKDEEIFELIHLADQHGMDSVIHAIGDRATIQAIDMIEKSMKITKRYKHHHAIIHAQLTRRKEIMRMKALNIGAIVQPIFINTDIKIAKSRIGERLKDAYLFHTMYQNIPLGFSTDAPIEPIHPFYNIYVAMTYKSLKYPELDSLNLGERFTLDEALNAYLNQNLPYIYEDQLPEGDFIVIDQDIRQLTPDKIKDVTVLKTVINGVEVFSKKEK